MKNKIFIYALLLTMALQARGQQASSALQTGDRTSGRISSRIISLPDGGFGYDILVQDHLLIHQPAIPGLPGNKGFKTREDAQSVALLVIGKLKSNLMPPTVTVHELDSLQIKK